jgi:hypothetical protein
MRNLIFFSFVLFSVSAFSKENRVVNKVSEMNLIDTINIENDFSVIKTFLIKIDTVKESGIDLLLDEIQKNKSTFLHKGTIYSTFDYIITFLCFSGNLLEGNRLKLVERAIDKGLQNRNNNCLALNFYLTGNLDELTKLYKNQKNNAFVSSLFIATSVTQHSYSSDSLVFIEQIDSIYNSYTKIPNGVNDFKLLLPMIEVLNVWKQKFPNTNIDIIQNYIQKKSWDSFENYILQNYVIQLFSNGEKIKTMVNPSTLQYSSHTLDKMELFSNKTEPKNQIKTKERRLCNKRQKG